MAAVGAAAPVALIAFTAAAMSLTAIIPLTSGGIGPVDAVGVGTLAVSGIQYEVALSIVVLHRSLGLGLMTAIGWTLLNYRLYVPPSPGTETIERE